LCLWFLENWSSSAQLKDVWKIKGIMDEPDTCEFLHIYELFGDNLEPTKQICSYSDTGENDDNDKSCDSDSSDVCGGVASNKFAALDISD